MVKHIILWDLKEELSSDEKNIAAKNIKTALENLKGKIDGLLDIKVNINPLASSNAEVILDSTFESEEALKAYQIHPEHLKAATEVVRPVTCNRKCMDYEI